MITIVVAKHDFDLMVGLRKHHMQTRITFKIYNKNCLYKAYLETVSDRPNIMWSYRLLFVGVL